MTADVRVLRDEPLKIILIKDSVPRSCAIPKTHAAGRALGLEQIGKMGAQRGHPGAAADENHFPLGRLDVKIAEGTDGSDRVAGLQVEDISRADAGWAVLAGRRSR